MTPYGLRHHLVAFSNGVTMIPQRVSVRSFRNLGGQPLYQSLSYAPWVGGEKLEEVDSQEGILEAGLGYLEDCPHPCPAPNYAHLTLTSPVSSCC